MLAQDSNDTEDEDAKCQLSLNAKHLGPEKCPADIRCPAGENGVEGQRGVVRVEHCSAQLILFEMPFLMNTKPARRPTADSG